MKEDHNTCEGDHDRPERPDVSLPLGAIINGQQEITEVQDSCCNRETIEFVQKQRNPLNVCRESVNVNK